MFNRPATAAGCCDLVIKDDLDFSKADAFKWLEALWISTASWMQRRRTMVRGCKGLIR